MHESRSRASKTPAFLSGLMAVERLRKQDEEFCRRLRIAVEMGDEFCPTTVITAPCTSRPVLNYMRTD